MSKKCRSVLLSSSLRIRRDTLIFPVAKAPESFEVPSLKHSTRSLRKALGRDELLTLSSLGTGCWCYYLNVSHNYSRLLLGHSMKKDKKHHCDTGLA